MSDDKKNSHIKAATEILYSNMSARHGSGEFAQTHYERAKKHMENHKSNLNPTEAKAYDEEMAPIITHLENVLSSMPQTKKLKKSIGTYNFNPDINPKQEINKNPGKDQRYDYKPFSALKQHEQMAAKAAYGNRNMEEHHYPVDKKTGSLVHGTRFLAPKSPIAPKAPMATEHVMAPKQPSIIKKSQEILKSHKAKKK